MLTFRSDGVKLPAVELDSRLEIQDLQKRESRFKGTMSSRGSSLRIYLIRNLNSHPDSNTTHVSSNIEVSIVTA